MIQDAMLTKSADVELVNSLGDNYQNVTDPDQAAVIADKLEELNKKWDWLLGMSSCLLGSVFGYLGMGSNSGKLV